MNQAAFIAIAVSSWSNHRDKITIYLYKT